MSVRPPHPFFEPGRPMVIAHRGGAGLAPENTLAAFDGAVALGVDAVELDVHLTGDARLVVCHDATVDRTTDGAGPIASRSFAELQTLDAGFAYTRDGGRTFPFRGCGLRLPGLSDVLRRHPHMRFSIELKSDAPQAARVLAACVREAHAEGRVCLGSFHDESTRLLRKAVPEAASHATPSEVARLLALRRAGLGWLASIPARVLTVPEIARGRRVVTPRLVRALAHRGVPVHVFGVDDVDAMQRLAGWGVRGIVTDRPDRALAARG